MSSRWTLDRGARACGKVPSFLSHALIPSLVKAATSNFPSDSGLSSRGPLLPSVQRLCVGSARALAKRLSPGLVTAAPPHLPGHPLGNSSFRPSPALMFFTKRSPLLTLPLKAKSSSSLFISKALEPCLSLLYPGPIRCPSRIPPEDWKGIFRLGTSFWYPATVHDRALKKQNSDIVHPAFPKQCLHFVPSLPSEGCHHHVYLVTKQIECPLPQRGAPELTAPCYGNLTPRFCLVVCPKSTRLHTSSLLPSLSLTQGSG